MPLYECVFIARNDVTQQQVEAIAEAVSNQLDTDNGVPNGTSVKKQEYWGLRGLAYRIKKNRKGHYVMMNIDAPPAAVSEMERLEKINEDVIRAMTIRVEELDVEPSPVLRSRDDRDSDRRGGREGGRF